MAGSSGEGSFREGAQLGKYRLVARLGTGGMAEVFLGRIIGPAGFTKAVAIKRMRPELTSNREFVDLFLEEARTASVLSHPNICHIHELTTAGGQYFMVMEYLEGVPLSSVMLRVLRQPRLFDLPFIAGVIEQAAEGLHHAHDMVDEQGNPLSIIHRDVSPPNLFVTVDGVVKVLDFGISKSRLSLVRTLTGQIRGKFSYMSPEQLRGETLDRRSDVFSLGIVLFELVTARRLFRRRTRLNVFHAIVKEPIPSVKAFRPELDDHLCAVIDRSLARDREARIPTARDLAEALVRASEAYGGPASSTEIGRVVQEHFSAELDSKRQLLSNPGASIDDAIDDVIDEGANEYLGTTTSPTTNLRHRLEPTAVEEFSLEIREFVDTSATTHAITTHDITEVDLVAAPPPLDFEDDEPIPPPLPGPEPEW